MYELRCPLFLKKNQDVHLYRHTSECVQCMHFIYPDNACPLICDMQGTLSNANVMIPWFVWVHVFVIITRKKRSTIVDANNRLTKPTHSTKCLFFTYLIDHFPVFVMEKKLVCTYPWVPSLESIVLIQASPYASIKSFCYVLNFA